jgi:hypothetical protein
MDTKTEETEQACIALLVNPTTRTVQSTIVAGYDGMKAKFKPNTHVDGGVLCRIERVTFLTFVDCDEFPVAPGWYSKLNPQSPRHGFAVVECSDRDTGEPIDCPVTADEFLATLVWEDWQNRVDPAVPNTGWLRQFGTGWGFCRGEPRYYTMEEA